jgi:excisionase family DNA binding protein
VVLLDDLMTTRQLQELLHVDRITIYRMLEDGRLPGFKVGGQWRFPRREVENWLRGQRGKAAPQAVAPLEPASPLKPDGPIATPCMEAIQDILAEACDSGAVMVSASGTPLTAISRPSAFCALILSTAEGRLRCESSWRSVAAAPSDNTLTSCHAGLAYVGSRVTVTGEPSVFVIAGQWRPSHVDATDLVHRIDDLAQACGLEPRALLQAWAEVPVQTHDSVSRATRLLRMAARTLVEMGQERARLLGRLQRIAEMTVLD